MCGGAPQHEEQQADAHLQQEDHHLPGLLRRWQTPRHWGGTDLMLTYCPLSMDLIFSKYVHGQCPWKPWTVSM